MRRARVIVPTGVGIGLHAIFEVASPGFHCANLRTAAAVVVDHCVAQYAIEPGNGLFLIHTCAVLQPLREGSLQDVLGHGARFHAAFEEREKVAMACYKLLDSLSGKRFGGTSIAHGDRLAR